jgi:hypothetical protein
MSEDSQHLAVHGATYDEEDEDEFEEDGLGEYQAPAPGLQMSKREETNSWLPPKKSSSRKKRKLQPTANELVAETVPLNDIRRTYPNIVRSILNCSNNEEILSYLSKIFASDTDFLAIVRSAESENPNGPVYREVQGIHTTARCFAAYAESMPDAVCTVSLSSFLKKRKGDSEIHCKLTYAGSVTYKVIVENLEQVADISSAVMGLNALGSTSKDDIAMKTTVEVDVYKATNYTSSDSFDQNEAKKNKIEVGETDILIDVREDPEPYKTMFIATQDTQFRVAQTVLTKARSFQTSGSVVLYCNKDKKVQKIEIVYSSQESSRSSKYTEVSALLSKTAEEEAIVTKNED